MNELIFLLHCLAVLIFMLGAVRLGKDALVAFVSASWLFANFFVTKQIMLFGFEVTASDVYAIGGMLGVSLIQEFFGKTQAIRSVWISFFILAFAALTSFMHINYIPSPSDTMHGHFAQVLGSTPRLITVSFITFFISGRLDIILFGFLQRSTNLSFALRSGISTCLVMLIDTALFTTLGLSGIVGSLLDVFLLSYLVKLFVVFILIPFLTLVPPAHDTVSL